MLDELKELATGLAVAIALLILLSRFIDKHQPTNKRTPDRKDSPSWKHEPAANEGPAPEASASRFKGPASIHQIFISDSAAGQMQAINEVEAIAHRGLQGDRYCLGRGHWSESDNCEVTMIAQEDLDVISLSSTVQVQQGQHRRNLVTRGIHLPSLAGRRFRIGSACFAYDRARPPCQYIQQITEVGMVKALAFRSGICVRCFRSGVVREHDVITLISVSPLDLVRQKLRLLLNR